MNVNIIVTFLFILFQIACNAQTQWTSLGGGDGGQLHNFAIDKNGRMYTSVGSSSTLHYSDNNGDSWTAIQFLSCTDISISLTGKVYVLAGHSLLMGNSITALLDRSVLPQNLNVQKVNSLSDGTILLLAESNISHKQMFYTSGDNGVTWDEKYEFSEYLAVGEFGFTFLITASDQIILGRAGGLYRSDDKGETFAKINNGISADDLYVVSSAIDEDGNLYRMSTKGIFKSTNNGDSWSSVFFDLPFTSNSGAIGVGGENSLYFFNDPSAELFKLAENASSWELVSTVTLVHEYFRELHFNPETSTLFMPSENSGLYRSPDDGETWEYADKGLRGLLFDNLEVRPEGGLVAFTSPSGYRLYDGESWSRENFDIAFTNDARARAQSFSKSGNLWWTIADTYSGNDSFLSSSDHGKTWTATNINPHGIRYIFAIGDNLYGLSLSPGQFYKSSNGGVDWEPIAIADFSLPYGSYVLQFTGDALQNILYLSVWNTASSSYEVDKLDLINLTSTKLSSGMVTTLKVTSDHSLWGVMPLNDEESLAQYNVNTKQWDVVVNKFESVFYVTAKDYFFLVGENGKMTVSATKGKYWKDISIDNALGYWGAITMDDAGIVYSAMSNGEVYKTTNSIIDTQSPVLAALTPSNSSSEIEPTTTIRFDLDEQAYVIAGKKLRVFKKDAASPVIEVLLTNATVSGNSFSFSIPKLEENTQYEVEVESGGLIDAFENSFKGIARGQWSFTTRKAKVVDPPVDPIAGLADEILTVQLYPNPATDVIFLSSTEPIDNAVVIDITGVQQKVKWDGDKLDVSNLSSGVYFIQFQTKQGSRIAKIFKQ